MNSAYYIFKRPDLIAKGEPFLEDGFRTFQAREHYTPNLAQEINLAAFQRQLIADKGSFDGVKRGSRSRLVLMSQPGSPKDTQLVPAGPIEFGPEVACRHTFRAALTERRINVDRVSTDGGCEAIIDVVGVASALISPSSVVAVTFSADSYSRQSPGCIRVVRVCSPQNSVGVVSGRVHRSPALRQRSWPNVDNQRTPRSYPQVCSLPGGICLSKSRLVLLTPHATNKTEIKLLGQVNRGYG